MSPKKVLVLDADNVLWDGIVGEEHITVPIRYRSFQSRLKVLQERGVLLAINSKNTREALTEAFAQTEGMVLRIDDFVLVKANWQDKASNLKDISEQLDLSFGSIVFIDDNPAELELIRLMLPDVVALAFPSESWEIDAKLPELEAALACLFPEGPITTEAATRTELYLARQRRTEAQSAAPSREDYLRSLELQAFVREGAANATESHRIEELLSRTTQFNLTGRVFNLRDLWHNSGRDEPWVFSIEARDRFGSYGVVGAIVLVSTNSNTRSIAAFCLSCRAIGYGLDKYLFDRVVKRCCDEGTTSLVADYLPTVRNGLVCDLYSLLGCQQINDRQWRLALAGYVSQAPSWITRLTWSRRDPHWFDDKGSLFSPNADISVLVQKWYELATQHSMEDTLLRRFWADAARELENEDLLRKLLQLEILYCPYSKSFARAEGDVRWQASSCASLNMDRDSLVARGFEILNVEETGREDGPYEGGSNPAAWVTVHYLITYARPGRSKIIYQAVPLFSECQYPFNYDYPRFVDRLYDLSLRHEGPHLDEQLQLMGNCGLFSLDDDEWRRFVDNNYPLRSFSSSSTH